VHRFSEAIGVVMGIEDSERGELVKLLTKRGEQVSVNAADVLSRKTFPIG